MPAQSLAESIGDCIVAAINARSLTFGVPPAPLPVVKRKTASLPAGKDPAQAVVIVNEEARSEPFDARRRLETYSVYVLFVTSGGHKLGFDTVIPAWRDVAKQIVDDQDLQTFATLIAGAEINRATYAGGKAPFDPGALGKDLDWTVMPFEIEVLVTRATP